MKKSKFSHKVIALFLITFALLIPDQANAQGPNAPEAASFEPVDATDMVSLITGDFTYVLPLLNVPSPEGGYPFALSYHSGIAMDQEASWVGLGWNINVGSINRGINGYPDDARNSTIGERFIDVGGEETSYTISASYTSLTSGTSIGFSLSHHSNKGFGGSVTYGIGAPIGDGYLGTSTSIGISPGGQFNYSRNFGYRSGSGFSIGGSIGTQGYGVNAGASWAQTDKNGKATGYGGDISVSFNSSFKGERSYSISYAQGEKGKRNGLGVSFSSHGISVTGKLGGVGIGNSLTFLNSVSAGDYTVESDSDTFGIPIPIGEGVLSIGYSRQRVKWYLNSYKTSHVSGALYLGDAIKYACRVRQVGSFPGGSPNYYTNIFYLDSSSRCNCNNADFNRNIGGINVQCLEATLISYSPTNEGKYFMDVNEVGVTNSIKELNKNNAVFPAFDSYTVNAQGLSGSLIPKVNRTGALLGLPRNFSESTQFRLNYNLPSSSGSARINFNSSSYRLDFYFKNQNSSSFTIDKTILNPLSSAENIHDYHEMISGTGSHKRKRDGRVVTYFTADNIADGTASRQGLLLPDGTTKEDFDGDYIAAYMITAPDGKTYHYSLPVFNSSTTSRTIGVVNGKPERESYFETNQGRYVTHWLLTAITGPDFVKGTGIGSWVRFEYGKWSGNFVWKAPYGKEYDISIENPNIKTKTNGRKEIYYLDRIRTRTHTALFIKNIRNDNLSPEWKYHAFQWAGAQPTSAHFDQTRWTIPSQKSLRLEKIILVKTEHDLVDKASGNSLAVTGEVLPSIEFLSGNPYSTSGYNLHKNILDVSDDIDSTLDKALKVVDFAPHYSYKLVNRTPNSSSGRLTLNGISFKGKGGVQMTPPYKFQYGNNLNFDLDKKDLWGYHKDNPAAWSLKKVITPTGGAINVLYESDDYNIAAAETGRVFNKNLKFTFFPNQLPSNSGTPTRIQIKVEVDDRDPRTDSFLLSDYFDPNKKFYFDMWFSTKLLFSKSSIDIRGKEAEIISLNESENSMIVEVEAIGNSPGSFSELLQTSPVSAVTGSNGFTVNEYKSRPYIATNFRGYSLMHCLVSNKRPDGKVGGGLRVRELFVSDGPNTFKTNYSYGKPGANEYPEDSAYISSGVISYLPVEENSTRVISYGSELPAPTPMYEYVTVKTNYKATNNFSNKTTYKFEVLKEKNQNSIQFGDQFKIINETVLNTVNIPQNKKVNISDIQLTDNIAALGRLLEVKSFNKEDNLLSKTVNNYAQTNEISQGVITESFQTYKEVDYESPEILSDWLLNTSTKTIYPSVLKSTSVTQGGYSSTTYYEKYDEVSGQLLETITKDSRGNRFKSEKIPAYHISEYSDFPHGMGPKVTSLGTYNSGNKNMLTQEAVNKTYIDVDGVWKETSVGITTWNNKWASPPIILFGTLTTFDPLESSATNIWRKHRSYVWQGDIDTNGFYQEFDGATLDNFDWTVGVVDQTNPKWKKISEITLYDNYSMPLEVKDINGNHAATRMIDNRSKIGATGNAKYSNMFSSGAEYYRSSTYGGQVYVSIEGGVSTEGLQKLELAHSGNSSIEITTEKRGFAVTPETPGKYRASVWAHKDINGHFEHTVLKLKGSNIDITPITGETIEAGDWVQYNFAFYLPSEYTEVYITSAMGTVYLDDFRLHPISSSMNSYVYNEWDELECILGANNLGTFFEYDQAGRLIKTYKEVVDDNGVEGGFKLISENQYNYKKVAEIDNNNNGVIDPIETYPPITLWLFVEDFESPTTKVKTNNTGGSGEFRYRWAQGNDPNNLAYGVWGTVNEITITTSCPDGRKYYKCEIKDLVTEETVEKTGNHLRINCDGNDGPGDQIFQRQQIIKKQQK